MVFWLTVFANLGLALGWRRRLVVIIWPGVRDWTGAAR